MAVFMVNTCKFRNCNLTFETLAELIQHIEESHIELDREENGHPQSIAMSRILRFYGGAKPKKSLLAIATNKKNRQRTNSVMSTSASIRSLTPTSSEYDFEDEDMMMDSCNGARLDGLTDLEFKGATSATEQQWTKQLILRMMDEKGGDGDKPFVCPIKGCKKRYKNINGVKYHARNGHKREARLAKPISKCYCGKSFHTAKQLDQHSETEHDLSSYLESAPCSDPKLSITVKDELLSTPIFQRMGSGAQALSIIHPITISGGVLLAPTTTRLKTVSKGDILVAHKIAATSIVGQSKQTVASLVGASPASLVGTSTASLVTPPNTPLKRTSNLSLSSSLRASAGTNLAAVLVDGHQKTINEKVAEALAAAKQAMAANAVKVSSAITTTVSSPPTIVTMRQ